MRSQFHLSIGVPSIEDSARFFTELLEGTVTHRDPSGYINIDLWGTQVTLQQRTTTAPVADDFHFGLNLPLPDFDRLAAKILASHYAGVLSNPALVDGGTPMERKKMYLRCPAGYVIELKGYRKP